MKSKRYWNLYADLLALGTQERALNLSLSQDYHLRRPEGHPFGWRYVLNFTEDWIKNEEDWPVNVQKRKREGEQKKDTDDQNRKGQAKEEHEWKKETNVEANEKHHDARADGHAHHGVEDENYQRLLKKYSPPEIALLRSLQHEKDYMCNLKQNDGKMQSPVSVCEHLLSIDEADQFSPDNWIPRSSELIRLTGKHPFNAEPKLNAVFDAGLVTPNKYHYVRNHGYGP